MGATLMQMTRDLQHNLLTIDNVNTLFGFVYTTATEVVDGFDGVDRHIYHLVHTSGQTGAEVDVESGVGRDVESSHLVVITY